MSVRVYPVTKTEPVCEDYRVKINGREMELNSARVSAVPFNRRWPGHQRQIEQTELINFASFATDGPFELEVIPKEPFDAAKLAVRPLDSGITCTVTEAGTIWLQVPGAMYFTVEPYGRNRALHIFADAMPEYDVDLNDPNVLYFGAGEHEVGLLHLKSGQTVFLDEGAVVYACIHAKDASDIRILGRGILDNSHNKAQILFEVNAEDNEAAVRNAKRLHTVQLEYCKNIRIDGITIRDSLVYNIRPIACQDITVSGVKIIGCWRYNSDGIDSHNCERMTVRDCFLRTYDDSICVKGFDYGQNEDDMLHNGVLYDRADDIHVSNVVIWNDWGKCLEIGAETRARTIDNILFENCKIIHVTGPVLDCFNVDYADVHGVTYRNMTVEYDDFLWPSRIQKNDREIYAEVVAGCESAVPPLIMSHVQEHPEYSAGGKKRGRNRELLFENIHLTGIGAPCVILFGWDAEHLISEVTVRDLFWNGKKIASFDEIQMVQNEFCRNIVLE